jgi:hypothetical protein
MIMVSRAKLRLSISPARKRGVASKEKSKFRSATTASSWRKRVTGKILSRGFGCNRKIRKHDFNFYHFFYDLSWESRAFLGFHGALILFLTLSASCSLLINLYNERGISSGVVIRLVKLSAFMSFCISRRAVALIAYIITICSEKHL